ncbi:MAG: type III pantothenate kinase, partial [candidate division WOR-3 bacterium]
MDAGNTNLHIGLAQGDEIVWHKTEAWAQLHGGDFRIPAGLEQRIAGAALVSVVPERTQVLVRSIEARFGFKPFVLDYRHCAGLRLHYRPLNSLGPDRIANAIGAYRRYQADVAVVDIGTATTLEFVTRDGDFLGGAILPGL